MENKNEIKYDIWKNRAEDCENLHPSWKKTLKFLKMGYFYILYLSGHKIIEL